jgi:DNA invertase Pin-like site-specific DNA recombinase
MEVVAYLRTSSATNVGEDKDSHKRQLSAVETYAKRAKLKIIQPPFYDAAVSGADPVHTRPGFSQMLSFLSENPQIKTILVETANRFARDLIVQETGYQMLKDRGIELIAVDSPDSFIDDTPTAELIRQVLGAVSQFEKSMIVSKLRAARERKRVTNGKCEGRKSYQESRPEVVLVAKKLHRKPRLGKRKPLRLIADELANQGYRNGKGNIYGPSQIRAMLLPG